MSWFKKAFPSTFYKQFLHQHHNNKTLLQLHSHLIIVSSSSSSRSLLWLWNTLINLYSQSPSPHHSLIIFTHSLPLPLRSAANSFTFAFLLKACSQIPCSLAGAQLHAQLITRNFALHLYVHTSLVNMYAACGLLSDARKAFDEMLERSCVTWNALITGFVRWGEVDKARELFEQMPEPDVVSWTLMIDGYVRIHRPNEALAMFRRMRGTMPSVITFLALIPSVSDIGSLELGEALHTQCQKRGLFASDIRIANTIIDMYGKCGSIEHARKVFDEMFERWSLVSWTSIINGYSTNGMVNAALALFDKMRSENVTPNRVTYLTILNACNHGGLVEEGLRLFFDMVFEHGIEPGMKHYGCLIDMLGRAGRLWEAEEVIARMPVAANVVVWRTLLGCCSKHGEVEMGERVMRRIEEMDKEFGGDYVVLSNMMSEAGRFGDAEKVRRGIEDKNLVKLAGFSLVGGKA